MTNIKDEKRNWRRHWLESIISLADIDVQRKMWLNKDTTNPHWSYVEFMCSYFDDSLIEDYETLIKKSWLTRKEYECIKDFHQALEQYKPPINDFDHKSILNDQAWQKIVALGKISIQKLKGLLVESEEQKIFTNVVSK